MNYFYLICSLETLFEALLYKAIYRRTIQIKASNHLIVSDIVSLPSIFTKKNFI